MTRSKSSDTASGRSAPDRVVDGTASADRIDHAFKDAQGDRITTGADTVDGRGGDDAISTGKGDDLIHAGAGDDTVRAGAGDDRIFGDGTMDARKLCGSGEFTVFLWDLSDIIAALPDGTCDSPFPARSKGLSSREIHGGTFSIKPGSEPIAVDVTDNDDTFDDGDGNQRPAQKIALKGASADPRDRLVPEYAYSVTDSHGEIIEIYAVEFGDKTIVALASDKPLVPGETYTFVENVDNHPEIRYGDLSDQGYFDARAGKDTLRGQSGDDLLMGEGGDDALFGGTGDDTAFGGDGDDSISGDDGDDIIGSGLGADRLFGGRGSDVFVDASAGDVIVGGEDCDGDDVDRFAFDAETRARIERIERNGGAGDSEAERESGTIYFRDGTTASFEQIEAPCFTAGTLIATPRGEIPVENLRAGDTVITRDNGIQTIVWAGANTLARQDLTDRPHLAPVLLRAGALGHGLPERDTMLSPNHRVLITGERAQLYFAETEVLSAAKHMIGPHGIRTAGVARTTYVHFMCERHEVVLSNGVWTESFHPGDYALNGLGQSQRREILDLFPDLRTPEGIDAYQAARKSLRKFEAKLLFA